MIYHLEMDAANCKLSAVLNGLLVYELDATYPSLNSVPVNIALIKGINKLVINAVPALPDFNAAIPQFSLNVKIKRYDDDDIAGPEKGTVIQALDLSNTVSGLLNFEGYHADFTGTLFGLPVIEDEDILKVYAAHLEKLMTSRDAEGLTKEFTPKFQDYARAYNDAAEKLITGFADHLSENYFDNYPSSPFIPELIKYSKWCDGRIWEISRAGRKNNAFFVTRDDEEGYNYSLQVYVAIVNGTLKVIR